MYIRFLAILVSILLLGLSGFSPIWAQTDTSAQKKETSTDTGFEKPYEYERKAYGYDPEGVGYHENQAEDFQVIFITSMPFTALASYGLTGLASLAFRNSFDVQGDYLIPFIAGTLAGSTAVACFSVLTNKYPPPASPTYTENTMEQQPLALKLPLVEARF